MHSHPYDDAVEYILRENDSEEAEQWLRRTGADYGVIHELDHEESREVVKAAYSRGAVKVEAIGHIPNDLSEARVDMLLIHLPSDKADREALFDLEAMVAEQTGFDRSIDEGQRHILLRWT